MAKFRRFERVPCFVFFVEETEADSESDAIAKFDAGDYTSRDDLMTVGDSIPWADDGLCPTEIQKLD